MRTFALTILLFIGSVYIFGQKPPELVVNALKNKFPSAINIKWAKQSNKHSEYTIDLNNDNFKLVKVSFYYYWEASFNLKNRRASAAFTSDGHWLYSEMELTVAELREEVKSAVKHDYPSCEIISIFIIENIGLPSSYNLEVRCGNNIQKAYYDYNGWPFPEI